MNASAINGLPGQEVTRFSWQENGGNEGQIQPVPSVEFCEWCDKLQHVP